VDDNSAKAIGKMVGAGAIVTGSFINLGDVYGLSLKAINMETAAVAVSYQADIAKSTRIETLLASGGAGTGTRTTQTGRSAASAQVNATPAVPPPASTTYKIGDTGPAGGIVFYTEGGGTSGMEASRLFGSYNWEEAIKAAKSFDGGGKNDWRLPTADELNLVYENVHKAKVADFGKLTYWSSSTRLGHSDDQDFSNGRQDYDSRGDSYSVRAVRNF
jgi:hypothetical protein